ncbi:hypothetical protein EON65_09670, partial [archaeon]
MNKNVHIKTTLLDTMCTLYAHTHKHTQNLQVSPSLCSKIASLLHDQHSGVRQLALDTLVCMHGEFRDVIMVSITPPYTIYTMHPTPHNTPQATLTELKVKAGILQQMETLG